MPMGLRSSAMCCQRITNAVRHISRSKGFGLVAYLDDMGSAEVWEHAQDCFIALKETLRLMGAVEGEHKSVSPSTKMIFLGVLFDIEKLTLEVSRERVDECMNMLDEWLDKREVRRKEIESLVGKLAFMAACVRPGRLFMSRVLEFLRGLPEVGKVEVPKSVRRDLLWWKVFLPQYNGVSMMPWQKWSAPDEVVATDACLQGCGAWFNSHQEFFHAQFPESVTSRNLSINALELLTAVVAAKVWGESCGVGCELWHTTHSCRVASGSWSWWLPDVNSRSEWCILRAWITAFLTFWAAGKLVGSRGSASANWLLEWWWRRNSSIKDCSSLCMTGRVGKWELFGCR